jgi:ketosteroid isomerase-like protein
MKLTTAVLCAGLLALGACDQVTNDPDIAEATAAVKGAVKDDGAALKQVAREARATREARPENQNTDESQTGDKTR